MIKLSIIIPTYNAAEFVPILANILRQLKHVEVLFIDDGSTDGTVNVVEDECREMSLKNLNASVIKSNHKGVSTSRNIGIERARGEYTTFIDADDLFNVDNLVKIINKLDTANEDIIIFQNEFNDMTVNMIENDNRYEMIDAVVLKKNPFQQKFIQPAPWAKLFRTKFLQENKIYFPEDVQFGEDLIFNVSCLEKSELVTFNSFGFYRYRNNLNSVSNKVSYDVVSNAKHFFNHLADLIGNDSDLFKEKVARSIINDSKRAIKGGKSISDVIKLVDLLSSMGYSTNDLNRKQKLMFELLIRHHMFLAKILIQIKTMKKNNSDMLYQEV